MEASTGDKLCPICKIRMRYISKRGFLWHYCNECQLEASRAYRKTNRSRIAERTRAYKLNNPEKERERKVNNRFTTYGITGGIYTQMLETQNNRCVICEEPFGAKTPHIDHDHVCCSGKRSCGYCTRGLLCATCNKGQLKDN